MKKGWLEIVYKYLRDAKIWIIVTISFLVIIHCLYKIHPKNEFFSAVWEAGDLISFVGTIVLGYVAYSQTKSASVMAEKADLLNKKFLQIQEREYIPMIKCLKEYFSGSEMLNQATFIKDPEPIKLVTGVFHSKNENTDPYVGYSLMITNNIDISDTFFSTRLYELHLQYEGKYGICDISFDSLRYYDNKLLVKEWIVNERLFASMGDGDQIVIFIYILDKYGSDMTTKISKSNKMEISLTLYCFDESKYNENITITKQLVEEYVPSIGKENVELMVSSIYEILEK